MTRKYNNSNPLKIHRQGLTLSLTIGLLLGAIGTVNAALSAVTAKTIQGTAPYITVNGLPINNISELLSIEIGGVVYTSDASGNMQILGGGTSTFTDAIELPNASDTFDSVIMPIVANNTNYSFGNIVPTANQMDDDGDINFTFTGNVRGVWKDQFNTVITTLTNPLDFCYSDYTLTLSTSGTPTISTQYGDPNITSYSNQTAVFKIKPSHTGVITPCFAKPNYGNSSSGYVTGISPSVWTFVRGFSTQSTSSTNNLNFPTTGTNNLTFTLSFSGASSQVSWNSPITSNGITATMSNPTQTSVVVTLTGPTAAAPGAAPWSAPFTLNGTDSSGQTFQYGFTLNKWFTNGGSTATMSYDQLETQCASNGYRIPGPSDISNNWDNTFPLPLSYGERASGPTLRAIGQGLMAEWGKIGEFPNIGFQCSRMFIADPVLYKRGTLFNACAYSEIIGRFSLFPVSSAPTADSFFPQYGWCVFP